VPNQTFTRRKADGAIATVSRKAYIGAAPAPMPGARPRSRHTADADQVADKEM
jgi:hypothetical protein